MKYILFLNDNYIKSEDAKISVFDTGFYYGDGVYEVALLHNNNIIDIEYHLNRLKLSCDMVNFQYPGDEFFLDIIANLIKLNNISNQSMMIYIQITRGVEESRYSKILNRKNHTVLVYLKDVTIDFEMIQEKGLSSILLTDNRRNERNIKMISLMPAVLSKISAEKEGVDYVLYKSRENDAILEGVSSNLFIVNKENKILTHPVNHEILSGSVRARLIDLLKQQNIAVYEELFYEQDLYEAKEVFITGSIKLINGIISINNRIINDGKVGPITKLAINLYRDFIS